MHEQGYSKSLIRRTITVMRLLHDSDNPTTHSGIVAVMRGIARKDKRAPFKAHPLSISDLTAMCIELSNRFGYRSEPHEYWRLPRDIALLTVGWCGALRAAEIVALNWHDIVETQQGVEITIRQSKTSQDSEILALPLLREEYQSICPVRALRLWKNYCDLLNLELPYIDTKKRSGVPANSEQPVFVNNNGARLNKRTVSRVIDVAARKAGLNIHLSSHSLRRGFATFAAYAGISERSLMRHGRWHTSAIMQGYVERAKLWTDNPVVQLLT
jgi:integrase